MHWKKRHHKLHAQYQNSHETGLVEIASKYLPSQTEMLAAAYGVVQRTLDIGSSAPMKSALAGGYPRVCDPQTSSRGVGRAVHTLSMMCLGGMPQYSSQRSWEPRRSGAPHTIWLVPNRARWPLASGRAKAALVKEPSQSCPAALFGKAHKNLK